MDSRYLKGMMLHHRLLILTLLLGIATHGISGCKQKHALVAAPAKAKASVVFEDATDAAGIRFAHYSGALGKKFMPETVGSGCAVLDYNGDGWYDLFYVNGTDWPGATSRPHYPALYRNRGDGTFEEVTRQAGLRLDVYGMGAAVGDYDNDGDPDLFLTCIGPNHLFRNDSNGRFTDVTANAGVEGDPVHPGGVRWKWSSSAAWVDYDRDGHLDLFVENYVKWTPATDPRCGDAGRKSYCPPTSFEGVPSLLYHNRGDGTFENVSEATGISNHVGKSFGIAVSDYNGDAWPDLAVSNDTMKNFLFLNIAGKRFEEKGLEAGVALSEAGVARAGMGIDAADWENNGRFGLLIGNFSREGLALYQNDGQGNFEDVSYKARIAEASLLSLTFGLFFFDYDLDGVQDVFAANGHIDDFVHMKDSMITYEQLPLLYRGTGQSSFADVTQASGPALAVKKVLRGCARGDIDNDGDLDIVSVWNNRRGELWRNQGGNANHWVGLLLRGAKSNRDGIGALIRLKAGNSRQMAYRRSGSSFLSEHDPRMVFGLGPHSKADEVEVTWPSGQVSRFQGIEAGRYYLATEGASALEEVLTGVPGRSLSTR